MRAFLVIAYVDPSAGSLLLQALLGGAAGLAVALQLGRRRLRAWLGRRFGRPRDGGAADEPPR